MSANVCRSTTRASTAPSVSKSPPKFGIQGRNPDSRDQVCAFFGTRDTVVNCKEEYLAHYGDARDFDGEHRLDPNTTITLIVPRILELTAAE